jgi:hypothetical protein
MQQPTVFGITKHTPHSPNPTQHHANLRLTYSSYGPALL